MSTPTYGSELRAAQELLDQVHTARVDNSAPAGAGYQVAVATIQLYRSCYRHTVILTGHDRTPLAAQLAIVTNHRSAEFHIDAHTEQLPTDASRPTALVHEAADHLALAADILFSQVGPDGTARTPAGIALLAGVDRDVNLTAIGRLVATTARIDRERQIHPATAENLDTDPGEPVAADPVDVLLTVAQNAESSATPAPTYLTGVTAAAAVSGDQWPAVTNHHQFVDALNAARTWLAQHYTGDLTGQHIRQFLGAGLALTNELGYLTNYGHDDVASQLRAQHASQTWRIAYLNTENVVSLNHHGSAAGPTALLNAEKWLRRQLRANGQWRTDVLPAADSPAALQWQQISREIARSLPDIATMLHRGVGYSTARPNLVTLESNYTGTQLIRGPEWVPATPRTPTINRLIDATRELRTTSELFCDLLDVPPHTGLHDASRVHRLPPPSAASVELERNAAHTARLLQQISFAEADGPAVSLPPAAAAFTSRLRRAGRHSQATTTMPYGVAVGLLEEVNGLLAHVARLQAQIDDFNGTADRDAGMQALSFHDSGQDDTLRHHTTGPETPDLA